MKKGAWIFIVAGIFLLGISFPGLSGAAEKVIKLGHVVDTKHPYQQ